MANSQFQYTVEAGYTAQEAEKWGALILKKLVTFPQLKDRQFGRSELRGLQANLQFDRDTASRLGITSQTIDNALYEALGQDQVSTIYKSLNQYHVVVEVDPRFQANPEDLKSLYVRSTNGPEIPLSAITTYQLGTTPVQINHQSQFPAVTLSFNIDPGTALGDAVNLVESTVREIGLPPTVHASFQGTAQAFQSSLRNPTVSDSRSPDSGLHRSGSAV